MQVASLGESFSEEVRKIVGGGDPFDDEISGVYSVSDPMERFFDGLGSLDFDSAVSDTEGNLIVGVEDCGVLFVAEGVGNYAYKGRRLPDGEQSGVFGFGGSGTNNFNNCRVSN